MMSHTPVIKMWRAGQYLHLSPAVRGLERYVCAGRHQPLDDPDHGLRVEKWPYPLVWEQKARGGRLHFSQCFAGLEPLVRECLEEAGCRVVMVGKWPSELPPPMSDNLDDFEAVDTPALELVRRHDRGLIGYDPGHVRPAVLIAQVARAWPRLKLVVVATRVNDARQMRDELSQGLGKVALFTGQHNPARGSRVVVATYSCLGVGAIGIEHRDVYIATNPSEIFATTYDCGFEGLRHLERGRAYGLLADDVVVAPFQRSLMTALFGFERVHVPRHGHHDLPVDVAFSRVGGGQRPPDSRDDLVILRQGVWQHPLRNRRVAALFTALGAKDETPLRERFPDVAGQVRGRPGGRVGLLVEGVEHGLALARLLPGVPLVTGPDVWKEGLSPGQVQLLKAGKKAKDRGRAIVTSTGLAHAGRFDVLVRADGGTGLPPLPQAQRAVANGDDTRLLLVDCDDRHHPVLRQRSRQRRDAYAGAGWNLLGQAAPDFLSRLMATWPGVG
jgi:hypothetical protein